MPTVTSQNLDDFNQAKIAGEPPEGFTDEQNNGEYNKVAAKADSMSQGADDMFSHREALKQHRVAMGLAQSPENRAYHRAKYLEHESMADKMERMERQKVKKGATAEKAAKARARYEAATRESN